MTHIRILHGINFLNTHIKSVIHFREIYKHLSQKCTVQIPLSHTAMYTNPCLNLQQYLDISIFKPEDFCFEPSIESMKHAQDLFIAKNDHIIQCISSTVHSKEFPVHDLPELAFLGRSNAGKSSLLKAILNQVPKLRIIESKKPGTTKCLKFYQIGKHMCLVDMPGYGVRQPKWFESSVIYYLKNRKNLVKTFLLIDGTEGFRDWDSASLQMLEDLKIPFAVLITKIDKVSDSQRLRNFLHLKNITSSFKLNTCFPQVFMLSSHSFEGLAYFVSFVAHITGNLRSEAA